MAVDDGRVVGFADLVDGGLLDTLFVHPDAGGRGVGLMLVEAVMDRARDVRECRVVTKASRVARAMFERLGFIVARENTDNIVRRASAELRPACGVAPSV